MGIIAGANVAGLLIVTIAGIIILRRRRSIIVSDTKAKERAEDSPGSRGKSSGIRELPEDDRYGRSELEGTPYSAA